MAILFQLAGLAGSILGLYGFYSSHTALTFIGLAAAVLFCKCNTMSMVEHILTRILILPLLSVIGTLICRFAVKMSWGQSFLICYLWVLAVTALLFVFSVIKENKRDN